MSLLIRLFVGLCLLRSNPQDLPASRILEGLTVATYFAIGVAVGCTMGLGTGKAMFLALADTVILVGLAYAVLWIADLPARRCQTIIALTSSGAAFMLAGWPLQMFLTGVGQDAGLAADLAKLVLILLILWSVVVVAHIVRHALSVSFAVAGGIAMLYAIFSIKVSLFITAN